MSLAILTVSLDWEQDLVAVRKQARDVAELLGFDPQDQTRIATAVSEIGRNAYRYAGGAKIDFRLEGATSPQVLVIRISDGGPGISNVREVLNGEYRSSTGMGLGITGTRRLVDQFDIESAPGKGTTVTLKKFLPRRSGVLAAAQIDSLANELAKRRPADGPFHELQQQNQELLEVLGELRRRQRVLVVDDDELSRYLIRQVLREYPCAILEAVDGYEALRLTRQQKPDLITLDLGMSGLNGLDILDELKADPGTRAIPVVIITSKLLSNEEREDLAARANAVLNQSELGDTRLKSMFTELLAYGTWSGRGRVGGLPLWLRS